MKPSLLTAFLLSLMLFQACHPPQADNFTPAEELPKEPRPQSSRDSVAPQNDPWPDFRGLSDRLRDGSIVEAPEADVKLAKTYPACPEKGPLKDGVRLTILTHKTRYRPNEEIRVLHFYEVTEPDAELFIMGPKEVFGEFVNGGIKGDPVPSHGYPWTEIYDGAVLQGPGVDYNFEISKYRFWHQGEYRIQWKLDGFESNVLTVTVAR